MYLKDRTLPQFTEGVDFFIECVYSDLLPNASIKCPCAKCVGRFYRNRDIVRGDLIVNGFMENYMPWSFNHSFETHRSENDQHENVTNNFEKDDIDAMVYDAAGIVNLEESSDAGNMDEYASKIFKMLEDGERPLFKGCKRFTSLSFITRLLHMKVLGGWSNKS